MTMTIRMAMLGAVLLMLLSAGFPAQAQTEIVENPDGSVVVTIDGEATAISAEWAAEIEKAVREHEGEPPALREAIRALVAARVGGAQDGALVVALAALAVFRSNGDSEVVAAVVEGANAGNPAVSTERVLAGLPAVTVVDERNRARTRGAPRRPPHTDMRGTVENPNQLSPAG